MGEKAKIILNEYSAKNLLYRDTLDLDKFYTADLKLICEVARKEIERLKTELQDTKEHLGEYLHEQEQENKRLNNIINELLKKIQFYKTTEWGLRGYGILENFENILNGDDVKSDR